MGRAAELSDYFRTFGTRQFRVKASNDGIGSGCDGDIGFGALEVPPLSLGPRIFFHTQKSAPAAPSPSAGPAIFGNDVCITGAAGLFAKSILVSLHHY
jgi:hypothetical protein